MFYTHGYVTSCCKCSGSPGADGLIPPACVAALEYSYLDSGASSYQGGAMGGCMTYIWFSNHAINLISK